MTDERAGADTLRDAIDAGRLSDAVVDAWLAADDVPAGGPWAEGDRFRLRVPSTDDAVPLDVLAAVLDASPTRPDSVVVHVDAGRRADSKPVRSALADLAAHPSVTVGHDETTGSVPLTDDTFDALVALSPSTRHLLVRDADGHLRLARTAERFTFALPAAAVDAVRSAVSEELADRLESVD